MKVRHLPRSFIDLLLIFNITCLWVYPTPPNLPGNCLCKLAVAYLCRGDVLVWNSHGLPCGGQCVFGHRCRCAARARGGKLSTLDRQRQLGLLEWSLLLWGLLWVLFSLLLVLALLLLSIVVAAVSCCCWRHIEHRSNVTELKIIKLGVTFKVASCPRCHGARTEQTDELH